MSSSETTGNSSAASTQYFTEDAGLQPGIKSFGIPFVPHTPSLVRCAFSRLDYGSLSLRPVVLLALLSELTRLPSSQRGRLHPGFRRFGRPPRRRISLQCQLGNLHRQDFHLLDRQLASLHYPGALIRSAVQSWDRRAWPYEQGCSMRPRRPATGERILQDK